MLELLEDDEKLCKMGENGRELALSFYRDTEVVKQHYALYRSSLHVAVIAQAITKYLIVTTLEQPMRLVG